MIPVVGGAASQAIWNMSSNRPVVVTGDGPPAWPLLLFAAFMLAFIIGVILDEGDG